MVHIENVCINYQVVLAEMISSSESQLYVDVMTVGCKNTKMYQIQNLISRLLVTRATIDIFKRVNSMAYAGMVSRL